jgi:hypothetical protein
MPHWIALIAIVIVGWLVLAVGGGWLLGRGLALFERREAGTGTDEPTSPPADDLRRAA